MSQPDAPQHPPHADQGVWQELELLLEELADDARRPQPLEEFYAALLERLTRALAGRSGAVWLRYGEGRLRMIAEVNDHSRGIADREAHQQLLAAALQRPGAMVLATGVSLADGASNSTPNTLVIGIVTLGSWLPRDWKEDLPGAREDHSTDPLAIVELALPEGRAPSSYRGARQLVGAACETAAEHHARRELLRLKSQRQERDQLVEFARHIARPLDLPDTALAIVNEGRRLLDCDRLSLLVARGYTLRLTAVSGVERAERRGRAARALEAIARESLKLREPIYYVDGQVDALPQVAEAMHHYVDEFHARVVAMVPMELVDEGESDSHPTRRCVGVLVAEQFTGTDQQLAPPLLAELAQVAAPAVATSLAWHDLPLGGVLRRLTWIRKPRSVVRAAVLLGLVVAAMLALATIQAPLRIDVRGQLLPVERQDVFAPRDALVDELAVEHGKQVAQGERLLTLRDPQLTLERQRIAGEIKTLERQLEAIRATRSTTGGQGLAPLERYRLSAQEEELATQRAGLVRQAELLEQEEASLEIKSPLAGQVITWQVEERLAGRPVERGQVLVSLANTAGQWQLELQIPDDQMDALRDARSNGGVAVEFRLGSDASQRHRATLTHLAQRADLVQLPTGEEVRSVVAYARPDRPLPADVLEAAVRPGGSVRARLVCGDHPLGYVWLRDFWRAVRNWWEF